MTIKEKLETIKGKKIAIWCETQEEAKILVDEFNNITGESYPTKHRIYKDRYYSLDKCEDVGEFTIYCLPIRGYLTMSYKEFINNYIGDYKIHLDNKNIVKILNDKYGKDNWVIK